MFIMKYVEHCIVSFTDLFPMYITNISQVFTITGFTVFCKHFAQTFRRYTSIFKYMYCRTLYNVTYNLKFYLNFTYTCIYRRCQY